MIFVLRTYWIAQGTLLIHWGVALQCCVTFYCIAKWTSYTYTLHFAVQLKGIQHCKATTLLLLFSGQVVSTSSQPHGLQHARLPCPSSSPRVCPSSCPSNQWCHPTISSSVVLFSFCLQSLPASRSFPMSQPFASGGQNILYANKN